MARRRIDTRKIRVALQRIDDLCLKRFDIPANELCSFVGTQKMDALLSEIRSLAYDAFLDSMTAAEFQKYLQRRRAEREASA